MAKSSSKFLRRLPELKRAEIVPLLNDHQTEWLHKTFNGSSALRRLCLPLLAPWTAENATPEKCGIDPLVAAIIARLDRVGLAKDPYRLYGDHREKWKVAHFLEAILRLLPAHGILRLRHNSYSYCHLEGANTAFEWDYFRLLLRLSIATGRTITLTIFPRKQAAVSTDFPTDSTTTGEFPGLQVAFKSDKITVLRCGSGVLRFCSKKKP